MKLSPTSDPINYDLDADLLTEMLTTIARESDRERILEYLLRRIAEYSGARRTRIVLERSGELYIRAALDLNPELHGPDELQLLNLEDHIQNCNELSAAVVNFAIHTAQPVLLEDSSRGRRFAHDPYIANHQPASIFCLPLIVYGEARGALYLENNTTRAVFSLKRKSLLEMLALQFLQTARYLESQGRPAPHSKQADPAARNLREWMQPHFLFNTLNLIQPLIFEDAAEASRSLNLLADGYRFLVELSGMEAVPLEKDWRFMEDYMKLMSLRFGSQLVLRIRRPLSFRDIQIPPLTLQPLIENALKYRRPEKNSHRIDVIARVTESTVTITVEDDGRGLQVEDPFQRSLGKIRQRLERCFESADLTLENRESGGARVLLRFSRARRTPLAEEEQQ